MEERTAHTAEEDPVGPSEVSSRPAGQPGSNPINKRMEVDRFELGVVKRKAEVDGRK